MKVDNFDFFVGEMDFSGLHDIDKKSHKNNW